MGIVKITTEHFAYSYAQYDYGSKEQRSTLGINRNIRKYFIKRFFLFEKFDDGILLDEESWYSVVAEPISKWLKNRLLESKIHLNSILEPFVGVGGIAVHLSCIAHRYIVNDLDPTKIEMLRNNLSVYGVDQTNIEFMCQDFLNMKPFKTDLVILCPPWGGTNLELYDREQLDSIMQPKLSDILRHARLFSNNLILQMPKNTNIRNLMEVVARAYGTPLAQIVRVMFNEVGSQLFVFVGDEPFTRIMTANIYQMLYASLKCESKEDSERVKKAYRTDPLSVLRQIYFTNKSPGGFQNRRQNAHKLTLY
ncbi:MAG: hypothetical protein JST59_01430 [Actinobacteria bacterium]|nr:hypothetical protein [Actinomycetota bacterium]